MRVVIPVTTDPPIPLGLLLVTERFDISAIEATAVEGVMREVSVALDETKVQLEG